MEYGGKAGGVEETRELGNDRWTREEVVVKDGAEVVEGKEGAWEGRLCEETERERVDVPVVQKPPSEVATTEDEEGAFTWAPALGEERRVLGALWGEGREQETAGGQRRGRNGWDEVVG